MRPMRVAVSLYDDDLNLVLVSGQATLDDRSQWSEALLEAIGHFCRAANEGDNWIELGIAELEAG